MKELIGGVAIILTFIAFASYIKSIVKGKTKPHVFSWVIWGIATLTVFAAQYSDGGGAGSWSIGVSGLITSGIAIYSYFHKADISITKSDWVFFILALLAIPLWYVTSDPMWSVILLTTIDALGYLPTFRKSYHHPHQENLFLYVVLGIRNLMSVVSLEHYSITTVSFPLVIAIVNAVFIFMVLWRRKMLD